jgi:hypothetical protein
MILKLDDHDCAIVTGNPELSPGLDRNFRIADYTAAWLYRLHIQTN